MLFTVCAYLVCTCTCIYNLITICFLLISTTAAQPAYNELIEVKYWEGFCQQSIVEFIALHPPAKCDDFAHLLLDDRMFVLATRREKPKNDEFIRAVLQKWFASVGGRALTCTWSNLIDCMKRSGLDAVMIRIIEDKILCDN